jgi:hypothetical protein
MDRGISEGDLIMLVTEGYGFPFDKMPGWVQNDIARLLDNEDTTPELVRKKTADMQKVRLETERVRAEKGLQREGGAK